MASELQLRPYQDEAVEEAVARGNQLLALVMGAGKTACAIRTVRTMRRLRAVNSGLVFALKSTKFQWKREIERWDPRASVQVVDGDKYQREKALKRAHRYHYTILHYETLVNDWVHFGKVPTDFVILDEATAIKNFSAKRTRRAKILGAKATLRIAMSGQPVENRPEELFSIMEFVDADVLGPFGRFDKVFINRDHWGKPRSYKNLHLIEKKLDGVMYRKSREDIAEWLPDLTETDMPVSLDARSWDLHELVREDLRQAIDSALAGGISGGFDLDAHYGQNDQRPSRDMALMGAVMARLLAMRMLSSHPKLLLRSADNFDDPMTKMGSQYASDLKKAGLLASLPQDTTKFTATLDLIEEILIEDPSYKVVLFSYFKPMLDLFEAQARKQNWCSVRVDGDVSTRYRDKAIRSFNDDPRVRLFLSSDAGAYGVDLHHGSHLINYDLPWSAGALAQRVARIDRTSSAFDKIQITYVYGQDTIEERMLAMLQQKRKVAKAFIDGDFDRSSGKISLDLESLREFVGS